MNSRKRQQNPSILFLIACLCICALAGASLGAFMIFFCGWLSFFIYAAVIGAFVLAVCLASRKGPTS